MPFMNYRNVWLPLLVLGLLWLGYRSYAWPGVLAVGGGLVMWLLLHFTRLMNVLQKTAERPIGHVGSAVMLHAKLRPGVSLLHVLALTRSLGQLQSPANTQPEVYRWTDASGSWVECQFQHGKLLQWQLQRPNLPQADNDAAPAAPTP